MVYDTGLGGIKEGSEISNCAIGLIRKTTGFYSPLAWCPFVLYVRDRILRPINQVALVGNIFELPLTSSKKLLIKQP